MNVYQIYNFFHMVLGDAHQGELGVEGFSTIIDVCELIKPKGVLEIGFNRGSSSLGFLLASETTVVSVDKKREDKSINFLKHIFKSRFHFFEMDSQSLREINGIKIDLIFIDGDHSQDGIKKDVELAQRLKVNYILFDDWFHGAHEKDLRTIVNSYSNLQLIKEYTPVCGQALFKVN